MRMDEVNYTYDGKFQGKILIVGRTGCGKRTFVKNLGKNNLFGDIKEMYWILKIELSKEREDSLLLADTSIIMSHIEIFALIDFIWKYLILDKNSA